MASINELAKEFLAQKTIAVAGVSGKREVPANAMYKLLRERGYTVMAVSPHLDTFDGDPCYPTIAALPSAPDGVVIVTRPDTTLDLVQQCIDAGVKRIWMHDMRGTSPKFAKQSGEQVTSVSAEAVRLCQEHGVSVIPGGCPRQYVGDVGHKCMRWMLQMMGALEVPPVEATTAVKA